MVFRGFAMILEEKVLELSSPMSEIGKVNFRNSFNLLLQDTHLLDEPIAEENLKKLADSFGTKPDDKIIHIFPLLELFSQINMLSEQVAQITFDALMVFIDIPEMPLNHFYNCFNLLKQKGLLRPELRDININALVNFIKNNGLSSLQVVDKILGLLNEHANFFVGDNAQDLFTKLMTMSKNMHSISRILVLLKNGKCLNLENCRKTFDKHEVSDVIFDILKYYLKARLWSARDAQHSFDEVINADELTRASRALRLFNKGTLLVGQHAAMNLSWILSHSKTWTNEFLSKITAAELSGTNDYLRDLCGVLPNDVTTQNRFIRMIESIERQQRNGRPVNTDTVLTDLDGNSILIIYHIPNATATSLSSVIVPMNFPYSQIRFKEVMDEVLSTTTLFSGDLKKDNLHCLAENIDKPGILLLLRKMKQLGFLTGSLAQEFFVAAIKHQQPYGLSQILDLDSLQPLFTGAAAHINFIKILKQGSANDAFAVLRHCRRQGLLTAERAQINFDAVVNNCFITYTKHAIDIFAAHNLLAGDMAQSNLADALRFPEIWSQQDFWDKIVTTNLLDGSQSQGTAQFRFTSMINSITEQLRHGSEEDLQTILDWDEIVKDMQIGDHFRQIATSPSLSNNPFTHFSATHRTTAPTTMDKNQNDVSATP